MNTIKIYDEKLGFTLDKTKASPTIYKITTGGAFETQLINNCSNVEPGDKITHINNNNIENYSYDRAVNYIKSIKKRPIIIEIDNKKHNYNLRSSFISTHDSFNIKNKISVDEMNKRSEQATKEALRELAEAHKENKEDDTSDYSSSEEQENYISMQKYNKLLEKNRQLELDKLNLTIENEDNMEEIKKKINPIKQLNDCLCHIDIVQQRVDRYLLSYKNDNSTNLNYKLSKFNQEYKEHIIECEQYLKNVQYDEIKKCIKCYIKQQKKYNSDVNYKINKMIKNKKIYESFQNISFIIILCLLFYIFIINN